MNIQKNSGAARPGDTAQHNATGGAIMFEITTNANVRQRQAPPPNISEVMEAQLLEVLCLTDDIRDQEARERAKTALRDLLKHLNQVKNLEIYWTYNNWGMCHA